MRTLCVQGGIHDDTDIMLYHSETHCYLPIRTYDRDDQDDILNDSGYAAVPAKSQSRRAACIWFEFQDDSTSSTTCCCGSRRWCHRWCTTPTPAANPSANLGRGLLLASLCAAVGHRSCRWSCRTCRTSREQVPRRADLHRHAKRGLSIFLARAPFRPLTRCILCTSRRVSFFAFPKHPELPLELRTERG